MNRRAILMAAAVAAPALALSTRAAQAKLAQSAAHYQTMPKDGKQCDSCNFFVAPNACRTVDGEISPTSYCALWAKKAA